MASIIEQTMYVVCKEEKDIKTDKNMHIHRSHNMGHVLNLPTPNISQIPKIQKKKKLKRREERVWYSRIFVYILYIVHSCV